MHSPCSQRCVLFPVTSSCPTHRPLPSPPYRSRPWRLPAGTGARRSGSRRAAAGGRSCDGELTTREREVLTALSLGASTGTIARQMAISAATTRSHVQSLLRKLGAHSRLEAVAIAVDAGLLAHTPARTGSALIWRLPPPAPASATAS